MAWYEHGHAIRGAGSGDGSGQWDDIIGGTNGKAVPRASIIRRFATSRWVCEAHADRPWNDHPNACRCGEPGMPCPVCNVPEEGERPAMPVDFTPHYDIDKGPIH